MNNLPAVPEAEMATGAIIAIMIVMFIYLAIGVLALASYILTSLSLSTIGSRRLIKNSWLSWLPVGRDWVLGKIAEEYDGKNGIERKWGKIMLTLSIIGNLGLVAFFVIYIIFVIMAMGIESAGLGMEAFMLSTGIGMVILFLVVYIAALICLAALQFLSYICYFKLYESTVPKKAVKYLLISLLVPFGMPICLYKAKDKGYMNIPEFLQPPVAESVAEQPATEEAQETVEQPQGAEVVASEPEQAVTEPTEQPKED